jgi:TRAP-type mannitol/chloroaromatic compound transport system permease small subunit
MKTLLGVCRAIDAMNERFGRLANWLVLLACLVSAGNAAARYSLNLGSNAWLEIQWYMFGALVMLGAPYTLKVNEHVRVDVLYGSLSTRAQLWIDVAGGLLFLLPATIIIGWLSWPMFYSSWAINEGSLNAGGLVRWPIKFFLPLGFLLLTLQGISEVIKRIAALTGDAPPPPHYEKPLQ